MKECCRRYVNHLLDLHVEWAQSARRCLDTDPEWASSYIHCVEGTSALPRHILSDIVDKGEPCPWHEHIPEDYLATMKAMGEDAQFHRQ